MGNFGRDDRGDFGNGFNRGGNRGGFSSRGRSTFGRGGGRSFRDGDRGDRPMFKTTCSKCGKDCEVPFRPTNGKPVYCSDCFEKTGGGRNDAQRRERSDLRSPSVSQDKLQFDAINSKLDKILAILEPKKVEAVMPDTDAKEVKETKASKTKKAVKKATPKK